MKRMIVLTLLVILTIGCNSDWGIFTDLNDGTVKLAVTAGTFGGVTYTTSTLYFAKCSYGQTYNPYKNSCSGSVIPVPFCNFADNSCNGESTNTPVRKGPLFNACNEVILAGKTGWRVPTRDELRLLIKCNDPTELPSDGNYCMTHTKPTIRDIFNSESEYYWSSSTYSHDSSAAWGIDFKYGYVVADRKTDTGYVRCVTGP